MGWTSCVAGCAGACDLARRAGHNFVLQGCLRGVMYNGIPFFIFLGGFTSQLNAERLDASSSDIARYEFSLFPQLGFA